MINRKDVPIIPPASVFIGPPKAPVTLMEYGDYECEVALHNDLIVREVLQRYPMVNFNYRHFPQTRIHQKAHKAAEAAIAAAQLGKFVQMHDLILHNRRNLGTASLVFYARELGIGGMNFLDSLVTGKYGRYVQDDLITGIKLGVKEAPTFFINGKRMTGKVTVRNLSDSIDAAFDALPKTKTKNEMARLRS
jgi:protein-disulfide isomerase